MAVARFEIQTLQRNVHELKWTDIDLATDTNFVQMLSVFFGK